MTVSDALAARAAQLGVATAYEDWRGERREVESATVETVVAMLDGDLAGGAPLVVRSEAWDHVDLRGAQAVTILTEDGETLDLTLAGGLLPLHRLPLGYHDMDVVGGDQPGTRRLVVVPPRCPPLPDRPVWGWQVQLYQLRSRRSWGMGDLADLRALLTWTGRDLGGSFTLVNPLHASAPVLPQEPSPYTAGSRRFTNPMYVCLDDLPERRSLDAAGQAVVARAEARGRALNGSDLIERDDAFRARREAWRALTAVQLSPRRQAAFDDYCASQGVALTRFATFCAIAERRGVPWQRWPRALHDPASTAVAAAANELADGVRRHCLLQWWADEQLAAVQTAALASGMAIGVIHDLAVGVDPGGADTWAQQDAIATGVTVGAPPDDFNQQGQDWALPPWRPGALRRQAYEPFRDMVRSLVRHGGGLRMDHALGLWRLWWIPEGAEPAAGTYVSYPADDLLGVLALEAHRARAIVVAEDLGTVPDHVPRTLRNWGIATSAVLWFEQVDGGRMRPVQEYPTEAFASVTTHDLPTARGFWRGEATRVRRELGLFPDDEAAERTAREDARDRQLLLDALREAGLVGDAPTEDELVEAVQVLVAHSRSALVAVSLADAVGDLRQPNLPGTTDEYPSWRLPLADGEGRQVTLQRLLTDPGVRRLAERVTAARRTSP